MFELDSQDEVRPSYFTYWIYESATLKNGKDATRHYIIQESEDAKFEVIQDKHKNHRYFDYADAAIKYIFDNYCDDDNQISKIYVEKDKDYLLAIESPTNLNNFRHGYGQGIIR